MTCTIRLRPATEDDLPAMARIDVEAFEGSRITTALFPERLRTKPGDEDHIRWRLALLTQLYKLPSRHWIVAVDSSTDVQDTVVGYAHWLAPGNPQLEMSPEESLRQMAQGMGEGPASLDKSAVAMLAISAGELNKLTASLLGDLKQLWCLSNIAVSPGHQRRGIGRMLLQWGTEKAEEEGRDIYIASSPASVSFYIVEGFEMVGEGEMAGAPEAIMVRRSSADREE